MMGSYTASCEIVELEDDPSFRQARMQGRDQKPPLLKGSNKFLKDDINKLFEAIDLRTSKSLDLPDRSGLELYRRKAEKKPMRVSGSQSPGIGFSEPVSLKQALRRQSISHASEMASMKRLSKPPGSPGMLESRKTSSSSIEVSRNNHEPKSMSANHSVDSSPRFLLKSMFKNVESALKRDEIVPSSIQLKIQSLPAQEKSHTSIPSQPCREPKIKSVNYISDSSPRLHHIAHSSPQLPVKPTESTPEETEILPSHCTRLSATKKGTKGPRKKIGISVRVTTKATPKLRRKGRLQTLHSFNATKSNKSIKSTARAVKKKEMHSTSATSDSKISDEKSRFVGSTSEQICQRCQCHLKDAKMELFKKELAAVEVGGPNMNHGATKPGFVSNGRDSASTLAVKFNTTSKSTEQEGFSQSSNSSIGEHSSSTTISDESNLSRSSIGIRPHMSKNSKWQAIDNVRKQHGFLELGHFSLLKKLGSGDIGTVYLAELIGTNCLFAIKVMDNDFLVRRRKMTRAQTESDILRMLDHPFLPTLYAKFTSDNLLCLVMEFCPGGDLHVLRQKQPGRYFPEQAARFYVAEVLLALEYLHMLGIIYRDLKPENIMVREDGHIMLTDFDLSLRCSVNPTLLKSQPGVEPPRSSGPCAGSNCIDPFCAAPSCKVSCFLPTATRARKLRAELAAHGRSLPQLVVEPTEARSNSFVGTHEYLAPEIIKGEVHGSSVDWWTLGIFLYELLYGKTPFKGAGNEETLANVVLHSLKFPDNPMVSCQARDLIRGLLVKEPENRFGTETGAAEIKRHPFFEGLNWALIRCAIPPQVPEISDIGVPKMALQEKGKKFLEYSVTGEHLEFELF